MAFAHRNINTTNDTDSWQYTRHFGKFMRAKFSFIFTSVKSLRCKKLMEDYSFLNKSIKICWEISNSLFFWPSLCMSRGLIRNRLASSTSCFDSVVQLPYSEGGRMYRCAHLALEQRLQMLGLGRLEAIAVASTEGVCIRHFPISWKCWNFCLKVAYSSALWCTWWSPYKCLIQSNVCYRLNCF